MIVYISIGNSDDKLTQAEWSEFCGWVATSVGMFADHTHGKWFSIPSEPWQSACWCVEIHPDRVERLKLRLRNATIQFEQDSIAWAEVPNPEFIRTEVPDAAL